METILKIKSKRNKIIPQVFIKKNFTIFINKDQLQSNLSYIEDIMF